jgi:hypothetical protein
MNGGVLFIALAISGAALVAALGYVSKRKLTSNREPMGLEAIHSHVSDRVSLEVFREVLYEIGRAYSVDPKLIRPEDSMDEFAKADSWQLDAGAEKLSQWLIENGVNGCPPDLTVLDLARCVESRRPRR